MHDRQKSAFLRQFSLQRLRIRIARRLHNRQLLLKLRDLLIHDLDIGHMRLSCF